MTLFFPAIILIILLAILAAGEVILFLLIRRQIDATLRLFGKTEGKHIVELLAHSVEKNEALREELQTLLKLSKATASIAEKSIHKVGIVRFNPFRSVGGEQSFSVAFLDAHNSGVVITSLYGQEDSRTYAKPIVSGSSVHNLSREERAALEKAMSGESGQPGASLLP